MNDKYKTEIESNKLLELLQKANEESLIDVSDYNQLPLPKGRGLMNEQ